MYRELSAKHEPPLCSTSWVEWRGGFFAFGGSLFAPLLPQPWAGEGGGLFCVGIIATKAPTDLCRPTMAPSSTGHCEGHTDLPGTENRLRWYRPATGSNVLTRGHHGTAVRTSEGGNVTY